MPKSLITKTLLRTIPKLGATEHTKDPIARVKLFTPDSNFTWYVTEYDPKSREAFGLVLGFEIELGYFSLDELESLRGPLGLPVERDQWFTPVALSKVRYLK
jgi:hypothetical protein